MMASYLNAKIRNIHCIGIGGAGMSGIAEILHKKGYLVSGSDLVQNNMTDYLEGFNIPIVFHHRASKELLSADLIVYSSAIYQNHPALIMARKQGITTISRGQMLSELMQGQYAIAVAGTHGKTSTVGLLAQMTLKFLKPTIFIGGYLHIIKSHAYIGESDYCITEADESDASFLLLKPAIAVITNIDEDHMETYKNDFNKLLKAYHDFLKPVSNTNGWAVLCYDDPILQKYYINSTNRSMVTYGMHAAAMIHAVDVIQLGQKLSFTIIRERLNRASLKIQIALSGNHSVLNILAAVAVGTILDIPDQVIEMSFKNYQGIARRFQVLGEIAYQNKTICIIDDYGHHPREISATLQAIHATWPTRRVMIVFQPHRYTRTRDLLEQFAKVLAQKAQNLVLLPVYAASEIMLQGINSQLLAEKIKHYTAYEPQVVEDQLALFSYLDQKLQAGDIILFQGAGNITQMAHAFLNHIRNSAIV